MSFCVLSTDQQVSLCETQKFDYNFNDLSKDKKLKNKVFYSESQQIDVLFVSESKENCEKFVRKYLEKNEDLREVRSGEFEIGDETSIRSNETVAGDLETVKRDNQLIKTNQKAIQQELKSLKKCFETLSVRVKKIEDLTTCAQIEINMRMNETHYIITFAFDEEDDSEDVMIEMAPFNLKLKHMKLNDTFRELCRMVFSVDELKEYAPKERETAARLQKKVDHLKLFAIKMHNTYIKKYGPSGVWDKRIISQSNLEDTMNNLTSVYHYLKGEERKGKGKKRAISEVIAPVDSSDFSSEDDDP